MLSISTNHFLTKPKTTNTPNMTKTTLTALGAALIALGQELQGEEAPPASTEAPKASRRGKAPTEPAAPDVKLKTEAQLRALFDPLLKIGKGAAVKAKLEELGGTKLADLPPENQPAFVAEVNRLLTENAKDIETLSM